MIVATHREPSELKEMVETPTTEEERAANRAVAEEFKRNVAWFSQNESVIRDRHSGQFIVVFGEELFFGEDAKDVLDRAWAAHPDLPRGQYMRSLSPHRLPRVYANQRTVANR